MRECCAVLVRYSQCCKSQETSKVVLSRLFSPYITTTILEDTIGELAAEVAAKYLTEYEKGRFRLKEEYARCVALCTVCPEQPHPHNQHQ